MVLKSWVRSAWGTRKEACSRNPLQSPHLPFPLYGFQRPCSSLFSGGGFILATSWLPVCIASAACSLMSSHPPPSQRTAECSYHLLGEACTLSSGRQQVTYLWHGETFPWSPGHPLRWSSGENMLLWGDLFPVTAFTLGTDNPRPLCIKDLLN